MQHSNGGLSVVKSHNLHKITRSIHISNDFPCNLYDRCRPPRYDTAQRKRNDERSATIIARSDFIKSVPQSVKFMHRWALSGE